MLLISLERKYDRKKHIFGLEFDYSSVMQKMQSYTMQEKPSGEPFRCRHKMQTALLSKHKQTHKLAFKKYWEDSELSLLITAHFGFHTVRENTPFSILGFENPSFQT